MSTSLIIIASTWVAVSILFSVLIFKAKRFSTIQKAILHIAVWCIPLLGVIIGFFTLHSSQELPWQNSYISGAPEAMHPPYEVGGDE